MRSRLESRSHKACEERVMVIIWNVRITRVAASVPNPRSILQ